MHSRAPTRCYRVPPTHCTHNKKLLSAYSAASSCRPAPGYTLGGGAGAKSPRNNPFAPGPALQVHRTGSYTLHLVMFNRITYQSSTQEEHSLRFSCAQQCRARLALQPPQRCLRWAKKESSCALSKHKLLPSCLALPAWFRAHPSNPVEHTPVWTFSSRPCTLSYQKNPPGQVSQGCEPRWNTQPDTAHRKQPKALQLLSPPVRPVPRAGRTPKQGCNPPPRCAAATTQCIPAPGPKQGLHTGR